MVESTTVILTVGAGGSREGLAKRVLTLVGPAKEEAAGGVAGADGDDQNEVAFAEAALRNGVAQPERDRGGSGVAVFVDVDHHFGIVHAEARLGRADDAQIGLVRDEQRSEERRVGKECRVGSGGGYEGASAAVWIRR